jgi:hypothetical protein
MALSATDIKVKILRNGDTLAGLARKWQDENPGVVITEQVLSRVIHRRAPYVYPEVKQLLANYLQKPVRQIGREPQPKKVVEELAEVTA